MRLGSAANQELEGGDSSALLCMVGRELCLFTTVDAGKVPDKQRDGFVALAVRRAAPFPDPEYGLAWTGDHHAAVWFWSQERVRGLLGAEGASPRIRFVPEAIHADGPVEDDAARLLALANGFEGRVWRQGRLVASRWWEAPPEPGDWQSFVRGAGLAGAARLDPVPAPLAVTSWGASARRRRPVLQVAGADRYLPRAMLVAGVAACTVFAFQAGSVARNLYDARSARQAALDLDAPLQRILDARSSADASLAEVEGLERLQPGRPQLKLMAEAARLLPPGAWEVRRWNQPTPDRLEVTLHMPDADPEQLVSTWEASPFFSGVTTNLQTRDNTITLHASVEPAGGTVVQ